MFLSIDTSTLTLTLALVEGRGAAVRAIEQVEVGPPKKQSEVLPGVIGELLARHGVALGALEGIAIGLGPGSFTGLRIGLATVKALAYASQLKVAGVSSLAAMALDGPENTRLFSCAVARVGELYLGRYRRSGEVLTLEGEETALTPAELAAELKADPAARLLGQGIESNRAALLGAGVAEAQLLTAPTYPSALAIAKLAVFPKTFDLQALFALEPHYLRGSSAERDPKFPPLPGPAPTSRIKGD